MPICMVPEHPYGRYSRCSRTIRPCSGRICGTTSTSYYRQRGLPDHWPPGKLPGDLISQAGGLFWRSANTCAGKQRGRALASCHYVPAREKKYQIINDPNGVQGSIRIARNFPNRHHPDFQKMQVLNNVFGGFFGSRLMDNIREDKGYTYGIHSYLLNNRAGESALMISTEAGKEVSARGDRRGVQGDATLAGRAYRRAKSCSRPGTSPSERYWATWMVLFMWPAAGRVSC